jgi:hypothetical protein
MHIAHSTLFSANMHRGIFEGNMLRSRRNYGKNHTFACIDVNCHFDLFHHHTVSQFDFLTFFGMRTNNDLLMKQTPAYERKLLADNGVLREWSELFASGGSFIPCKKRITYTQRRRQHVEHF